MELTFKDKVLLQTGKVFLKMTSQNIFGDATYAYIVSDREKLEKLFKEKANRAYISYSDYGDMIMFGKGEPDEHSEQMAMAIAMKKYS